MRRPKLEPQILVEDPEKSYHAPHHVGENEDGSLYYVAVFQLHPSNDWQSKEVKLSDGQILLLDES